MTEKIKYGYDTTYMIDTIGLLVSIVRSFLVSNQSPSAINAPASIINFL